MTAIIIATAGALLLIAAGRGRKPAPQPVRTNRRR